MRITDIEKNKKNNGKVSVYIDNKYSFTISEEDYLRLNLYEKRKINEDEINYIKNEMNFRAAKSQAIKFLALKLRCEKEICDKLSNECIDDEVIVNVINSLKDMGYINDKIYVEKYINDRTKLKPCAKRLIKYELQNKGISEDLIDHALNALELDEYEIAEGLIRRKFSKYDLDDDKIKRRVYSFLLHRGFTLNIINDIITKIKDEKNI